MARRSSLSKYPRRGSGSQLVPDPNSEAMNALGIGSRLSFFATSQAKKEQPPGSHKHSSLQRQASPFEGAVMSDLPDIKILQADNSFNELLWRLGQQHEAQLSAVLSELERLRMQASRLTATSTRQDGDEGRQTARSLDSADVADESAENIWTRPRETVARSPGLNPQPGLHPQKRGGSIVRGQAPNGIAGAPGNAHAQDHHHDHGQNYHDGAKLEGNSSARKAHTTHSIYAEEAIQDAHGHDHGKDHGHDHGSSILHGRQSMEAEQRAMETMQQLRQGGKSEVHNDEIHPHEPHLGCSHANHSPEPQQATLAPPKPASGSRSRRSLRGSVQTLAHNITTNVLSTIWGESNTRASRVARGESRNSGLDSGPQRQASRRTQLKEETCCPGLERFFGPSEPEHRTFVCAMMYWFVKNNWFESFFAVVIVCNAVFIGAEVEYMASGKSTSDTRDLFETTHHLFSILFLFELSMRLAADRLFFFTSKESLWNLFDFTLVCHSIVEFIVKFSSPESDDGGRFNQISAQRTLRVVRIIRNVRIVRVLRVFDELRMMLYAIFGCVKALLWLIVLLLLLLYFFAVFFTQGATEYTRDHPEQHHSNNVSEVKEKYGSLPQSMFSLYKGMTAGVSWGELVWPLEYMHWFYIFLFLVFISFTIFAVLNVVTGVFVDSALQQTHNEQEVRQREEEQAKVANMRRIKELFHEIDADGSGSVSIQEFSEALQDEYVHRCFEVLQINTFEAEQLFHLLDPESQGQVQIDEFVKGCMRLKGEAKSIDIAVLIYESRRMMHRLKMFMLFVVEQFENISDKKCWHTHPPDLGLIRFSSSNLHENLTRGSVTGDDIVRNLRADDAETEVAATTSSAGRRSSGFADPEASGIRPSAVSSSLSQTSADVRVTRHTSTGKSAKSTETSSFKPLTSIAEPLYGSSHSTPNSHSVPPP